MSDSGCKRVYYFFNPSDSSRKGWNHIILGKILAGKMIKISLPSKANDSGEFQFAFPKEASETFIGDFRRAFRKAIDAQYGFISFSERYDNVLMWSHYAAAHRGFALELELPEESLHPVIYSTSAPEICVQENRKIRSDDPIWDLFMRTKSIDWAYEKEERMIIPFKNVVGNDNYARIKDEWFFKIPPSAIKALFVGLKCKMKEETIKAILGSTKLSHIKVYRMSLARNGFDLECPQLEQDRRERINKFIKCLVEQPKPVVKSIGRRN